MHASEVGGKEGGLGGTCGKRGGGGRATRTRGGFAGRLSGEALDALFPPDGVQHAERNVARPTSDIQVHLPSTRTQGGGHLQARPAHQIEL